MKVSLKAIDSVSKTSLDLSNSVTDITCEWSIFDTPGKLSFSYIENGVVFQNGSQVWLIIDDTQVFNGFVFSRGRDNSGVSEIQAYDRLRYLQNPYSKAYEGASLEDIFNEMMKISGVKNSKIIGNASFVTAPVLHDNKMIYEIIKRGMDETLIGAGVYFIIRDNFGTLELIDIADKSMKTQLLLGDSSLATGFQLKSSIDSQTYNFIKLYQENKETKKRDVYIAQDTTTIRLWGTLALLEKVDEEMTEIQIKQRADQLLKLYNRETRTLRISAIGDLSVREGCGVGLSISALEAESIPTAQYTFASKVVHKFSNGTHTMDLDLEVL
jgi:hypothetical protein